MFESYIFFRNFTITRFKKCLSASQIQESQTGRNGSWLFPSLKLAVSVFQISEVQPHSLQCMCLKLPLRSPIEMQHLGFLTMLTILNSHFWVPGNTSQPASRPWMTLANNKTRLPQESLKRFNRTLWKECKRKKKKKEGEIKIGSKVYETCLKTICC